MERIRRSIRNPLSIIALFASLSEVTATGVLPLIPTSLQNIFIWFVMGFPVLLVGLFFYTLHKRHHVLYAPSDYKSDESFTGLALRIRSQNPEEIKHKKIDEIKDFDFEVEPTSSNETGLVVKSFINNPKVQYFLAEELAIKKLTSQYGDRFAANKVFEISGSKYYVDGIINTSDELSFFEIKYFPRLKTPLSGLGKTYNYFSEIYDKIKSIYDSDSTVIFNIVIVTGIDDDEKKTLRARIDEFLKNKSIKINISIMDYESLKEDYGLSN